MKHKDNFGIGIWGVKVTLTPHPTEPSLLISMKITRWKVWCWYIWQILLGQGHTLI
jgi:hypothetical protein